MVKVSISEWTPTNDPNCFVRLWGGLVYHKEVSPIYYGGHQIKKVSMHTLLGREWLAKAN